jgi:ligand-binding sensor domain-containing protein
MNYRSLQRDTPTDQYITKAPTILTKKIKIVQILILTFLTITVGGTSCNGPVKKDLLNEKEHPKLIKQIGNGNLSCIIQDKVGNLWVGTSDNGLYQYDGKSFKQFLVKDGLSSNDVYCLLEDTAGKIWIGTKAGLSLFNGKTFTSIGAKENFNSRGASAILQDDKNNFWITTFDKGVWYYDGKTCKNFMEINGLVNNAVMSALKDKNGNIWFGTKFVGLSRYDGSAFTTFSQYEN